MSTEKLSNKEIDMKAMERLFMAGVTVVASVMAYLFIVSMKYVKKPAFPTHDCKSWKTSALQHKTNLITNTACTQYYFLLILVLSVPPNFERRNLIRQMWGSDNATADKAMWKTFFLLGETRDQTLSDLLKNEERNFGDVIRGNYYEHYQNLSFKVEMGFEWAARYCNFSFLLKTDDDVFVNTKDLILYLQQASTPKRGLYMGKALVGAKPRRDGKHGVSLDEFSGLTYPDYCSGAGYVLSYDVVECLVPLFDVVNPFWIEDVYVGILVNKAGFAAVDHKWFIVPVRSHDCYFLPNTFIQHRVIGECLIKLYRMHSTGFYDSVLGSFF